MRRLVLCVNSGSSSIKFAVYRFEGGMEHLLVQGAVERIGLEGGWLWLQNGDGTRCVDEHGGFPDHKKAVASLIKAMKDQSLPDPDAVGHRLVHGGPNHKSPERVTRELTIALRKLIPFAPLHLPSEIRAIDALAEQYPQLQQVACFDTAFHRQMPELAQRFPLPRSLWQEGVYRYGFHGISFEYIVSVLADSVKGKVIIAHLGNGASMVALQDGRPLDTTMGLTPMGGFMMGTRSGDLDPGLLIYLMDEKGYDARQLERLLNRRSGLMGVSGISSDMKTLLEQRHREPHAAQAVEMFCYHARKAIGALSAVLGGLDTLVFTGGIGERAAPVRWKICQGLEYLGVVLDPQKNDAQADLVCVDDSPCEVRVIPTNEDLMIARHTKRLLDLKERNRYE